MSIGLENVTVREKPSRYINKAAHGLNVRIISPMISGWEEWVNGKPLRYKEKPEKSIDPTAPAAEFWAFIVWDYDEEAIKIWSVKQQTIQNGIKRLADQGMKLQFYRLAVSKEMAKGKQFYKVNAIGPSPAEPEIRQAFIDTPCDLSQMFGGGDPWSPKDLITEGLFGDVPKSAPKPKEEAPPMPAPKPADKAPKAAKAAAVSPMMQIVNAALEAELPIESLEQFMAEKMTEKNCTKDVLIGSILAKAEYTSRFLDMYRIWLQAKLDEEAEAVPF